MNEISRSHEKRLKQLAVMSIFWAACPVEEDYGYDAIMNAAHIDKDFEDEHALFIFNNFKSENEYLTEEIKSSVARTYHKLKGIISNSNAFDINEVKVAAMNHLFKPSGIQGPDGGFDRVMSKSLIDMASESEGGFNFMTNIVIY